MTQEDLREAVAGALRREPIIVGLLLVVGMAIVADMYFQDRRDERLHVEQTARTKKLERLVSECYQHLHSEK